MTKNKGYRGLLKLQTNYPDKPAINIRITGNIRTKKRAQGVIQ